LFFYLDGQAVDTLSITFLNLPFPFEHKLTKQEVACIFVAYANNFGFYLMGRPCKCRIIEGSRAVIYFKPCAVPLCELEEVELALDEFEALRLADFEGLYQEDAAERMGISRQTFANILRCARRKVADVMVCGKALKIMGTPPEK